MINEAIIYDMLESLRRDVKYYTKKEVKDDYEFEWYDGYTAGLAEAIKRFEDILYDDGDDDWA